MGESDMAEEMDEVRTEKGDRSSIYVSFLHHLTSLATSPSLRELFLDLMTAINLSGYTPFMAAIASKVIYLYL